MPQLLFFKKIFLIMTEKNFNKIDFIGVGVPRAATTWILKCLEAHPEVCIPKIRALGDFFAEEVLEKRNFAGYRAFFSHCLKNQRTGHIETGLLYAKKAPAVIKKLFPKIKLIVCLRNPIERLYSHYLLKESRGEPFNWALHQKMGLYFYPLKRYLDNFPAKQILVLIYEDIEKDPLLFIQNIYRFLGINHKFVPRYLGQKINPTAKTRQKIPLLNSFNIIKTSSYLKRSNFGRKVLEILRYLKFPSLVNFAVSHNIREDLDLGVEPMAEKPSIGRKARLRLWKFYKKDIAQLEKLIKRDLSFWK